MTATRYTGPATSIAKSNVVPAVGDLLQFAEGQLAGGDGATPARGYLGRGRRPSGPLAGIGKASTGVFRVLLTGTSKQSFDRSAIQIYARHLQSLRGSTEVYQSKLGAIGSLNAYSGWLSQRYGGLFQYRMRADSTATPFNLPFYGDTVELDFSVETNAEACDIVLDGTISGTTITGGTVLGQTPAAGAQAYGYRQTFTVTEGAHTVAVRNPVTGYVYWEYMTGGLAARTGVEVRDATLGGSLLAGAVNVSAADSGMATSIAISGNTGLDAMTPAWADLILMGYIVNDAGSSATNFDTTGNYATVWKPAMDYLAQRTAANGTQLVLIIETPGHYLLSGTVGSGIDSQHRQYLAMADYYRQLARNWPHITCIDHAGAMVPPADKWSDQTTMAAWAARFYPGAGTLTVATGAFTGSDFIHEDPATGGPSNQIGLELLCQASGIETPKRIMAGSISPGIATGSIVSDRIRAFAPGIGRDVVATIAGTKKAVPAANGPAYQCLAPGTSSFFQGRPTAFIRDAAPTNYASAAQAAIDASSSSDRYGTYLTMSNYVVSLSGSVDWASGKRLMMTIRARGTVTTAPTRSAINLKTSGPTQLYPSISATNPMPRTDATNGVTSIRYMLTGDEPAVFSVVVGSTTAASALIAITGDVYEITFADADTPTLIKNAPASGVGPTGPTGPAGGVGSGVISGLYSLPTIFGAGSTTVMTVNELDLVPFVPLKAGTISGLALNVSTAAASSSIRLGIYGADSTTGRPAALLGEISTPLDSTTTGFKSGTFATPVAVTAGLTYWLGAVAQGGTPTVQTINGFSPQVVSTGNLSSNTPGYRVSNQSAALIDLTSNGWSSSSFASIGPVIRALAA